MLPPYWRSEDYEDFIGQGFRDFQQPGHKRPCRQGVSLYYANYELGKSNQGSAAKLNLLLRFSAIGRLGHTPKSETQTSSIVINFALRLLRSLSRPEPVPLQAADRVYQAKK